MSKLSDALRRHLATRGLDQKAIAATFHGSLKALGAPHAIAWSTAETKLSKLLGGQLEGERFFFEDPTRLQHLAVALDLSEQRLRTLREVRTLVLHPGLPLLAAGYLQTRADASDALHDVAPAIPPSSPASMLVALRDAALRSPRSLVVLPEHEDERFFADQHVETTKLRSEPRGWVLIAAPDLVPLPPPPAPQLWLSDESPLFPCGELVEHFAAQEKKPRLGWDQPERATERLAIALRLGQEPTFNFGELARFRRAEAAAHGISLGNPPGPDAILATSMGTPSTTHVWAWKKRVFALGPKVEQARALLGGDGCPHTFETPRALDTVRTAFERWNPWVTLPDRANHDGEPKFSPHVERDRWNALRDEVRNDCGVDTSSLLNLWWRHARDFDPAQALPARASASASTRAALREVADRKMLIDADLASVLFRLQAAAGGLLLEIEPATRERFHVIAHLGGGHLLRIRCLDYPHEHPTNLRSDRGAIVGGDITVFCDRLPFDVMLEGSGVGGPNRRQRAAEEEMATSSAWDDD